MSRDKLIVKGLGAIDGEYEFDLYELLGIGTSTSLTNRELHRIKEMTGVRAGELIESLAAGDNDVVVGLAAVILTRNRRAFTDDLLWDAPAESSLAFQLADREADPQTPTEEAETSSASGGVSSTPPSAKQENGQSPTGTLDLATHRVARV